MEVFHLDRYLAGELDLVRGYTRVAESIVSELQSRQVPFVIIEDQQDAIGHIKRRGFDVLRGDPTDRDDLEEANMPRAASVFVATDSDAENTLVALTASGLREEQDGICFRIVVRIENEENVAKVRAIGIDEIISPSTLGGRLMERHALCAAEDAAND